MKNTFRNLFFLFCFYLLIFLGMGTCFASFPDTINHQYSTAIDWVQADGIVSGYSDGYYRPNLIINRAEFTKIIIESVVGGTITGSNCFPDVTNEWFAKYICTAKVDGIVGGNADGTFKPSSEVNYVEALKIVLEAYHTDFPRTRYEYWYSKYIEYALDLGLSFASSKLPHSFITRAEMAEIIYWINNPQPIVTPTTPITPTAPTACKIDFDCSTRGYTFCEGTWTVAWSCQSGQCVKMHMVDCAVNGIGPNCRETALGAECY